MKLASTSGEYGRTKLIIETIGSIKRSSQILVTYHKFKIVTFITEKYKTRANLTKVQYKRIRIFRTTLIEKVLAVYHRYVRHEWHIHTICKRTCDRYRKRAALMKFSCMCLTAKDGNTGPFWRTRFSLIYSIVISILPVFLSFNLMFFINPHFTLTHTVSRFKMF